MLSGRGLCDELITRPEESYRLWFVVACDLETSRMGAPYIYIYIYIYIYDISSLRAKVQQLHVGRYKTIRNVLRQKYGKYANLIFGNRLIYFFFCCHLSCRK